MCRALNKEEWLEDERFNTSAARVANAGERKEMTGAEIEKWDSDEILERFQEEGVPSAPLLDRMELMAHPQILANDSIERAMHDGFGEVRQARPAAQFSETPSGIDAPAPRLGQHGREILSGLGYDDAAMDALIENGKLVVNE